MAAHGIDEFLKPLAVDSRTVLELSHELASTFRTLSAESTDQFLPTPISESILRPLESGQDHGRFLAIDIGGTNLRIGFIELLKGNDDADSGPQTNGDSTSPSRRLNRLLEHSWPIGDHLKNENSESLFSWIGDRIAHVVRKGCEEFGLTASQELPLGVAFSFPMQQTSLAEAKLMTMGKGFAITSNLDLGGHLTAGYEKHRTTDMPPITIAAIANDAVATLVSFIYQLPVEAHQKAVMGVIVGTGCNATIPLTLSSLHESKRPASISILPGQEVEDVRIAVNTEWSINGSAPPLRKFGLISRWDEELDRAGECPGFQPLEYMTAGRYLGELARLIFLDYCTSRLGQPVDTLPERLRQKFGLTTTFLSHFYDNSPKGHLLDQLNREFPPKSPFEWAPELQVVIFKIAKAIEIRAAGIVAASTIGLLRCAEEIPEPGNATDGHGKIRELVVGYTGGCIQHFQNYLADTQEFIDEIMRLEFGGKPPASIILRPCHDGGITGAGILVPAACGNIPGRCKTKMAPSTSFMESPIRRGRDHNSRSSTTTPSGIPTPTTSSSTLSTSDEDDEEPMDPNEFDLLLSRSVSRGASMLEPEAIDYSMLRNTQSRSRSRAVSVAARRRRSSSQHSPFSGRRSTATPDEQAPLLPPPLSSPTDSGLLPSDDVSETENKTSPYLEGLSVGRFWLLFAQILMGHFICCFDGTIMASSHPVITSYFGSSNSASWLSTAFLLTSTSFQPLLGGLSNAIGRKRPYIFTTGIFLVATIWCALARSMAEFIIARAVCGLGAGGIMTLGSIIMSDVVPIEIRGTYQSYINIVYGVGSMLGAALGGAMADYLGWRWEFGVQVPVLAAGLVISIFVVPSELGLYGKKRQTVREAMETFDFAGSALMSTSVTALILGLNLGGNIYPWSHPIVLASLTFFAIFFPLFIYVESRAIKPIMPIHLVFQSPHMNLIIGNHLAAIVINAIIFNVPLFFQGVLLTSATTSGFRLVLCSLVSSACGTATGFLITWTRRLKWPLVLGASCSFIGTLALASMQRGWPTILYLLCLIPASAGQGFQFPGTFMAVLAVSSQQEQAVVTSTLILWRSLGMVLGVSVSSLVVQNALWFYLEKFVIGPEKDAVVEKVRQSVEAIRGLPFSYREQVVESYAAALRVTFICCSVLALGSLVLVGLVKVPRLGSRK
ncbi:major facilitator superfamily domain-containing protein [Podospora australis]|uniref:Major facilitator superfamily domain-containing protein n=1 Tax=Podospora australis TaxID=1536484 RepID=A0AAN7AJU0_9PEZI|nr:major facilitator superfamily domain-containing protein [Podospora australis]